MRHSKNQRGHVGKIVKVGVTAVLLASLAGCAARRYFTDYLFSELEGRLNAGSGLVEAGAKAQFKNNLLNMAVDLSGGKSESTIEGTGNKVEENRFTSDFNIIVRNQLSIPFIYEKLRATTTTPGGVKESDLESKFFTLGAKYNLGLQSPIFVSGRFFLGDSLDKTIAGNITTDRRGFCLDASLSSETLTFLPLLTLDKYKIDAGAATSKLSELQLGLAAQLGSFMGNLKATLGGYLVHAEEDGDETNKLVGDLDLAYLHKGRVLGVTGSYDGNLGNLGFYGTLTRGNASQDAKTINDNLREIQRLNLTERGLPDSVIQRSKVEAIDALQDIDNLFCLVGFRQQYNPVKDEIEPVWYAYVAFPINSDKEITGAVTVGPAFDPYPEDAIDSMWALLCGFPLGQGKMYAGYEKTKYETLDPKGALTVRAIFPFN